MRNIDLESLHIFKAVVEYGGITRAASQLNRVQSNITTRVKNLEERLGVSLFQRQSGKLVLSPEGKLLLNYADRLLNLSDEAESAVRSGKPNGILRIGTMESTAAARLPSLLSRYHQQFPEVQIELVTGTSGALVEKVHNFAVEAAFVAAPCSLADLESQEAFAEELVLITPKAVKGIKSPKDLHKHTVIAFSAGCSYRRILENWLGMSSIVPSRILELGSYHAIVACVAAGSGIAIVPRSVLKAVHAEREVRSHPLPEKIAHAKTYLAWKADNDGAALKALREILSMQKPVACSTV
jgi:DNA-binding transcriptional LysR family regulator